MENRLLVRTNLVKEIILHHKGLVVQYHLITLFIASGAKPILNTTQGGTQTGLDVFGENVGQTYTVTASGGKYYLDGTVNPMISMIRGATYVFDYSVHLVIHSDLSSTSISRWTQYSNGVVVSGNVTSITVPFNVPDTLYYYCTFHSGMGNSISVTTDETKTDIYVRLCSCSTLLWKRD